MKKYSYAPLIKAIDAYLAKADDDLADELEASGFAEPNRALFAALSTSDTNCIFASVIWVAFVNFI